MSLENPFENPTPSIEKEPHIPSLEEIKAKMESLIGQEHIDVKQTIKDDRVLEDRKGVCSYEVITVDESGNESRYIYTRKGVHSGGQSANTGIHVVHYVGTLENNSVLTGQNLSDYDESTNQWVDKTPYEKIQGPIEITVKPTESYLGSSANLPEDMQARALETEKGLRMLYELFEEAESIFGSTNLDDVIARENSDAALTSSIRKEVRPLLNAITTQLQNLSRIKPGESLRQWNPSGYLSEEQFHILRKRRVELLNAVGAINVDPVTKKTVYRHDIEPINLIESESDK